MYGNQYQSKRGLFLLDWYWQLNNLLAKEGTMRQKRTLFLSIPLFLFSFVFVVIIMPHKYNNDFSCYKQLAAEGGDAQEVRKRLVQYKEALIEHGLESGDYAVIFTRPDRTHEAHHAQIDSLIRRAEELENNGENSVAYQMAMFEDFRARVLGLPKMTQLMTTYNYWWLYWVMILTGVWAFLAWSKP